MDLGKTLKFINLSIAVLLVLVLAAVYWIAYRPLPATSGQISAPVSAPAAIARDALGVPHITAGTWEDAIFLQGYTTAQDRLWQMDVLRRLAAGELSEVFGPSTLELDREARRMRMRRIAEDQVRALAPAERAIFAAYARGVNFFIETHRNALPLEFTVLRYDPRPWSILDSTLCGLQMYRSLTTTWREELRKMTMLQRGDPTAKASKTLTCSSNVGSGGPGYSFSDENLTSAMYPAGTVAMANAGPNTNGSQFFLVFQASQLPPDYTPFGTISAAGLAVLHKVATAGTTCTYAGAGGGVPRDKVVINSVAIAKD